MRSDIAALDEIVSVTARVFYCDDSELLHYIAKREVAKLVKGGADINSRAVLVEGIKNAFRVLNVREQ